MLKAALNFAHDEGAVTNREAWGRRLKPFRAVDAARVRYLTVAQPQRLLHSAAADADFAALLPAALETGCKVAVGQACTQAPHDTHSCARPRLPDRRRRTRPDLKVCESGD